VDRAAECAGLRSELASETWSGARKYKKSWEQTQEVIENKGFNIPIASQMPTLVKAAENASTFTADTVEPVSALPT
jgi:hypothetical protein